MTKKRARAIATGIVIVIAVAFIFSSAWQLFAALFLMSPKAVVQVPSDAECTAKLRVLASALDRAADRSSQSPDEEHARTSFEAALAPEWNDAASAENACNATRGGVEAWAALLRFRRALEVKATNGAREVGPLRRDFEARLP